MLKHTEDFLYWQATLTCLTGSNVKGVSWVESQLVRFGHVLCDHGYRTVITGRTRQFHTRVSTSRKSQTAWISEAGERQRRRRSQNWKFFVDTRCRKKKLILQIPEIPKLWGEHISKREMRDWRSDNGVHKEKSGKEFMISAMIWAEVRV